ncbi:MAG: hypothetical protein K2X35_06215 [Bryobacteraceae bacterium]|nr:hypothetical protein [Bryobacteraceae bacterium]
MIRLLTWMVLASTALLAQRGGGGMRPMPRPMGPGGGGGARPPVIVGGPAHPGFVPSIVNPGTPIPALPPGASIHNFNFPRQLSGAIQGNPAWGGGFGGGGRGGFGGVWGGGFGWNQQRGVLPVYVPIPVGGGWGWGWNEPQTVVVPQPVQAPNPPVVVINQNYRPEQVNPVLRDYSDASLPEPGAGGLRIYEARPNAPAEPARSLHPSDKPTIYLIALNDASVLSAVAYWVEGETLNYVTPKQVINRVSLALVDRDLTQRLNGERGVELRLPR